MRKAIVVVAALVVGVWVGAVWGDIVVPASDGRVCYVGRVDRREGGGPRMEWSNSGVRVRFRGTGISVRIGDTGENYYGVRVDGGEAAVVHPGKGESVVALAAGLADGEHGVEMVRRTEAHLGVVQFREFRISGEDAGVMEVKRPGRKIEVIGDSISCGYGNESANEKVHFTPKDENALESYGAIAARALGAEYVCIAWSGRKMWPDFTIPEVYDLALPTDPASGWDFSADRAADAVLINLGTNDFGGKENPDEGKWTGAYEAFVRHVRATHAGAMIYLASGSMMSDGWPPGREALSTLKRYLGRIQEELKAGGDLRVRVIHFEPQDGKVDGLGGDWHPSLKTHRKMAEKWEEAMRGDLGWE